MTPGPAVGVDGTIYAASNAGVLHAVDPKTGGDRWTFDGGGPYGSDLSTTPAVLDDGTVLWPGPGDALHAVAPTGEGMWRLEFDGLVLSPVVTGDRLVIADMGGGLHTFRWTDGDRRVRPVPVWSLDHGTESYSSPAVADGVIYAAADHHLLAVDLRTGAERWRFETGALIEVSPSIAADGIIVVASNDPFTYGIGPDGVERWRHRRGALSFSSPATTETGLVYAGDHQGGVAVLDARTGERVARYQAPWPTAQVRSVGVWTAPLIDGVHRVYFGTRHGHILGFAPDGTRLFDITTGATVDSYPALTADGALVVGVTDGRLLAIADDTTPCAAARRARSGDRLAYSPNRPDAIVGVATDASAVAIGLDDGPDLATTTQILDVLDRHDATATFFVIGERAARLPQLVRRIVTAGHEVGHHTFTHHDLLRRPAAELDHEIDRTTTTLRDVGVMPAPLLRPPRGQQDPAAAEATCLRGLLTVGWTVTLERHLEDPAALAAQLQPGDIVLAHDGGRDRHRTADALDELLQVLDARDIAVVGVGQLLAGASPSTDPADGAGPRARRWLAVPQDAAASTGLSTGVVDARAPAGRTGPS